MSDFAKLFRTANGQILVTIDWDEDIEQLVITVRGEDRHGIGATFKMSGWYGDDENAVREAFDAIDQAAAETHAKSFADMLDGLVGGEAS
jgi:hypothetical protein